MERRKRKRPLDDAEIKALIESRIKQKLSSIGEVTMVKIYEEMLHLKYSNDFEHSDLYGFLYRIDDRIDPFFTEVEDKQEALRLIDKYKERYKRPARVLGYMILLLIGPFLDLPDRIAELFNTIKMFIKP